MKPLFLSIVMLLLACAFAHLFDQLHGLLEKYRERDAEKNAPFKTWDHREHRLILIGQSMKRDDRNL